MERTQGTDHGLSGNFCDRLSYFICSILSLLLLVTDDRFTTLMMVWAHESSYLLPHIDVQARDVFATRGLINFQLLLSGS